METRKSAERRKREGWYDRYIRLPGLDVGCANDKIHPDFDGWDKEQGDAACLPGIPARKYSTVYASHILEHLDDPSTALRSWWEVLGRGCLIVVVPDRDLYEKKFSLPSNYNAEHKTFWKLSGYEPPNTFGLIEIVQDALPPSAQIVSARILDDDYERNGLAPAKGEFSIEMIVRKVLL